jgi:phage protein D
VEGSNNAYQKLTVGSPVHVFKEKSIGDIVKKVAEVGGLTPDVDVDEDSVPIRTKKGGRSYLDFLRDLAKEGTYEVELVDDKLRFGTPRQDEDPIVTLEWGKNLISFRPNLNTSQAVAVVIVRGWDKQRKKPIAVQLRPGEETRQEPRAKLSSRVAQDIFGEVVKEITDRPVNSVEEARKLAKSELNRIAENLIRGSATTIGLTQLRPGVCVQLDKLGAWFTGKYYLEKVTHRLDDNGYRTTFEGRRNAL